MIVSCPGPEAAKQAWNHYASTIILHGRDVALLLKCSVLFSKQFHFIASVQKNRLFHQHVEHPVSLSWDGKRCAFWTGVSPFLTSHAHHFSSVLSFLNIVRQCCSSFVIRPGLFVTFQNIIHCAVKIIFDAHLLWEKETMVLHFLHLTSSSVDDGGQSFLQEFCKFFQSCKSLFWLTQSCDRHIIHVYKSVSSTADSNGVNQCVHVFNRQQPLKFTPY